MSLLRKSILNKFLVTFEERYYIIIISCYSEIYFTVSEEECPGQTEGIKYGNFDKI